MGAKSDNENAYTNFHEEERSSIVIVKTIFLLYAAICIVIFTYVPWIRQIGDPIHTIYAGHYFLFSPPVFVADVSVGYLLAEFGLATTVVVSIYAMLYR